MGNFLVRGVKIEGDRYEVALQYIDKLFIIFPDFDDFRLHDIINQYESDYKKSAEIRELVTEISHLLDLYSYVETGRTGNLLFKLTDHGRNVKKAGGHFKYSILLENQKIEENQYKEKLIEKIDLDIDLARFENVFGKRIKVWGIMLAALTLIISIASNFLIDFSRAKNNLLEEKIKHDSRKQEQPIQTNKIIENIENSDTLNFNP